MDGTILFVCSGNFCRSPMAEAILKGFLRQDGKECHYRIHSAGTWTRDGLSASPLAIRAMQELGLDISAHRSRHLTSQDVAGADLIIVMTRDHKEALSAEFPEAREKLCLLSELADQRYDIADPSGSGSLELHKGCAHEIKGLLTQGYSRILSIAASGDEEG